MARQFERAAVGEKHSWWRHW